MTDETMSPEIARDVEEQLKVISRGTVDMLPEGEFAVRIRESIENNKPLRVKQGFDPTAPDIHVGHTVGIRKLRQFQDLGHKIVLIVGDCTAMVGDPSGKSATRPLLTHDDIMKNAETYQDQFFRILDKSKTEIHRNGEWFEKMDFGKIMDLATRFTVARMLERDDFTKRIKRQDPISIHELFYPLLQAYDSVAIEADVEIGATDQTFNLLAGRTVMESFGLRPQIILTMPLLVGLDGEKKMSKSLGNYIGIDEPPKEIFGKAMSIPDDLIYSYFELATNVVTEKLAEFKERLDSGKENPMVLKKQLGVTLVDMYYEPGTGQQECEAFEKVFSKKQLPDDMPEKTLNELTALDLDPKALYLVGLIHKTGMAKSSSEARKLIQAGAVSIDGEKITAVDHTFSVEEEVVLKVGKRRFLKIKAG